jgi:hypothetical protein
MTKRWPDFLVAVAVRLFCGFILGALAGLFFGWKVVLRWEAHDKMRPLVLWLVGWAVGGAVIAVLRIPFWQTPWYTPVTKSTGDHTSSAGPHNFQRVSPQFYNRALHPTLKQYHDFIAWLRQVTTAELQSARSDAGTAKAALILFFQRGFKAGLTEVELTELLPTALNGVGYSDAEYGNVVSTANTLDLRAIRSSVPERCEGC